MVIRSGFSLDLIIAHCVTYHTKHRVPTFFEMKYFIDCGTHFFQGLKKFDEMYNFDSSWVIYSFEVNPITYELSRRDIPKQFKALNLIHENKAVSTENGVVTVNCEFSDQIGIGEGSNILKNPPDKDTLYGMSFLWSHKKTSSF